MKLKTSDIAAIAVCAALYAGAIAVTAPIPTPWGVGHVRPGVVVPAFFAVAYGPYIGGLGGALGTFIGSLILATVGLSSPPLSLVSGVPGNFAAFFLLGWLLKKRRSWYRFVWASLLTLFIGNLVAASGVMGYFTFFLPIWASWSVEAKIGTIAGLTLFWLSTMLPFVLPIVPALLRVTAPTLARVGVDSTQFSGVKATHLLSISLSLTAVLAAVFTLVYYSPLGEIFFAKIVLQDRLPWVKSLILVAAASVALFGPLTSLIGGLKK